MNNAALYSTPPWIVWSLIVAGAVMLPIGVLVVLRRGLGPKLVGVGLMTLAPALCWMAAWAASSQYALVADDHLEFRSGMGRVQTLRFADCRGFEFQIRQVSGDRGRPEESVVLVATFKDGRTMDLDYPVLGGRVLDDLVERLKKAGIPVVGDRRGL